MTLIDDNTINAAVESLRVLLAKLLVENGRDDIQVTAKREYFDFWFECRFANLTLKTDSLDFTMAKSEKEWTSILTTQARLIISSFNKIKSLA